MNEHIDELKAAVEAHEQGVSAGVGAFDFGLLTVILPIILKMVIKSNPALLEKLTALVPAIVAFVEKLIGTFVTTEAAE